MNWFNNLDFSPCKGYDVQWFIILFKIFLLKVISVYRSEEHTSELQSPC